MNLIEKIGSYEEIKDRLSVVEEEAKGNFTVALCFERDLLKAYLLEHRRENNIFEVGDKIIVVQIAIENRSVYEILNIDGDILMIEDEYLYIDEIRHATPEEIKAGHRL